MESLELIVASGQGELRESLRRDLEALGHRVTVASDSAELLRLALKVEAQLALVDLDMGPLGGVEVVSLLKDVDDALLVVPIAGEDSKQIEFAVRSLGIFYYIVKPVHADELEGVLESAGRRRGKLDAARP
jgi:DNA-binding response OmpR family regulator